METKMNKVAIIYHKDCNDGFAAAYLVVKATEKENIEYNLYSMRYGDIVPDITDSCIYPAL